MDGYQNQYESKRWRLSLAAGWDENTYGSMDENTDDMAITIAVHTITYEYK